MSRSRSAIFVPGSVALDRFLIDLALVLGVIHLIDEPVAVYPALAQFLEKVLGTGIGFIRRGGFIQPTNKESPFFIGKVHFLDCTSAYTKGKRHLRLTP